MASASDETEKRLTASDVTALIESSKESKEKIVKSFGDERAKAQLEPDYRKQYVLQQLLGACLKSIKNDAASKAPAKFQDELVTTADVMAGELWDDGWGSSMPSGPPSPTDLDGALLLYRESLAVTKDSTGKKDHDDCVVGLTGIGLALEKKHDLDGSLEAFQEAQAIIKQDESDKHQQVHPKLLSGMARVLEQKGQLDEAIEFYGQARTIRKKVMEEKLEAYDAHHFQRAQDYALALRAMAQALIKKGSNAPMDSALELYQEVLSLKEKKLTDHSPEYRKALASVANMLDAKGDIAGAIERYKELKILLKAELHWVDEDQNWAVGKNSDAFPPYADTLASLGILLHKSGDKDAAQVLHSELKKISEQWGSEHPQYKVLADSLSRLEDQMKTVD
eukprot:TRINITY_DN107904_c0_g1_i1.p1 TRINITY_DN107904_c0_g1~~TRINITY_DN107904_c0_g1_i1.p1  ORF type:complete len:412 (-),score=104.33 TRINITY_DN107904_c0_g1_i1:221-1402(-)